MESGKTTCLELSGSHLDAVAMSVQNNTSQRLYSHTKTVPFGKKTQCTKIWKVMSMMKRIIYITWATWLYSTIERWCFSLFVGFSVGFLYFPQENTVQSIWIIWKYVDGEWFIFHYRNQTQMPFIFFVHKAKSCHFFLFFFAYTLQSNIKHCEQDFSANQLNATLFFQHVFFSSIFFCCDN